MRESAWSCGSCHVAVPMTGLLRPCSACGGMEFQCETVRIRLRSETTASAVTVPAATGLTDGDRRLLRRLGIEPW